VRDDSHVVGKKKSLVKMQVWDMLSWCNSRVFPHFHTVAVRRSRWVCTFHAPLTLSSLNASPIIARISVALFPRFAQNFMLFLCRPSRNLIRPRTGLQTKRCKKSVPAPRCVHTISRDMLVASRNYICCTDGSTSPRNYGYPQCSWWEDKFNSSLSFFTYLCFSDPLFFYYKIKLP
jgi:hypothetical protein